MDIHSINAQAQLASIASSIGRNPLSWRGWDCLNISWIDENEELQQDCLIWTKSILESYLRGVEGRVYSCGNNETHIFCKNVAPEILQQAAAQICDLVRSESGVYAKYKIYDLESEGFEYAQSVLEKASMMFSIPVSYPIGVKSIKPPELDDAKPEAGALSNQGATKVLLIEDDPVTRWMVRSALKQECEFATAPTANKAFSMYTSYQPDVVFLDIDLPDKNGYAVLEWIMRNDPGACVVMFSSNNQLDNIASALQDGASGFVAKPFLKENLLHYIHAPKVA